MSRDIPHLIHARSCLTFQTFGENLEYKPTRTFHSRKTSLALQYKVSLFVIFISKFFQVVLHHLYFPSVICQLQDNVEEVDQLEDSDRSLVVYLSEVRIMVNLMQ